MSSIPESIEGNLGIKNYSSLNWHSKSGDTGKAVSLSLIYENPHFHQAPVSIIPESYSLATILWEIMEEAHRDQHDDPTLPASPMDKTYVPRTMIEGEVIQASYVPKS